MCRLKLSNGAPNARYGFLIAQQGRAHRRRASAVRVAQFALFPRHVRHTDIIAPAQGAVHAMEPERAIDLELFLREELVPGALVRKDLRAPGVVGDVVVFIPTERGLEIQE